MCEGEWVLSLFEPCHPIETLLAYTRPNIQGTHPLPKFHQLKYVVSIEKGTNVFHNTPLYFQLKIGLDGVLHQILHPHRWVSVLPYAFVTFNNAVENIQHAIQGC